MKSKDDKSEDGSDQERKYIYVYIYIHMYCYTAVSFLYQIWFSLQK